MKLNPVKLRVLQKLSQNDWTCRQLAERCGRTESEVSDVLRGRRFSEGVQENIAQALGMSVGRLFGEWAWFRVAAKKLKARQRQAG